LAKKRRGASSKLFVGGRSSATSLEDKMREHGSSEKSACLNDGAGWFDLGALQVIQMGSRSAGLGVGNNVSPLAVVIAYD
jgi:hypothetical protein